MVKSRYDRNRDGRCDHPACRNVGGLVNAEGPLPRMAAAIAEDLRQLGIQVTVRPTAAVFDHILDPTNKVPLVLVIGWQKDFGGAASFFDQTFSGPGPGRPNFSLLGATRAQLADWDYGVRSVPSVDAKIEECQARVGAAAFQCWAEADQLLMERVVPWAPFFTATQFRVVSERVANFSFAQSTTLPALDQIALTPGSG
jgi:ABC-type transport system substrate-binding protein